MVSEEFCCVVKVLRNHREQFHYAFADRIAPNLAGLYVFWLESGACLYVGRSINLRRRLREHKLQEDNPELQRWFRCFSRAIQVSYIGRPINQFGDAIATLEQRAIRALRPLTNVQLQPK